MKNIVNGIAILGIIGVIALSCTKKTNDCADAICTQEFRSISITVNNQTAGAQPFVINVTDLNSNLLLRTVSQANSFAPGTYTIFTDGDMQHINQTNTDEVFKVEFVINGNIVKTELYELRKDCCHINKSTGENIITLN